MVTRSLALNYFLCFCVQCVLILFHRVHLSASFALVVEVQGKKKNLSLVSKESDRRSTTLTTAFSPTHTTATTNTVRSTSNINFYCLKTSTNMLRNIDLPECIIFYGMETIMDKKKKKFQPGLVRLLKEAHEVETATLLLSESKTVQQMKSLISEFGNIDSQQISSPWLSVLVELRSSLELPTCEESTQPHKDTSQRRLGKGYSPSPAALLDAVSSVVITPKGFGGSGGFGTKYSVSTY